MRRAVVILFALGFLFFFVWTGTEEEAAAMLATLSIAAGLSLAHPSSLAALLTRKRFPALADSVSAMVFLIAAFLLLCAVGVFFQGPANSGNPLHQRLTARVEWVYTIFWLTATIAPLLAQIFRGRPTSMGPAVAGIAGGMLMAFGLFFSWIAFGQKAMASAVPDDANAIFSTIALPVGGLIAGLGFGVWRSAFRHRPWRFSDNRNVFSDALLWAAVGIALGCLICAYTGTIEVSAQYMDWGTIAAATLCALIGCAWIAILLRLGRQPPVSFWRGLAAIGLLVLAIPASLVLSGAMVQTRDWAEFTVVFLGPIAIVVAIGVLAASLSTVRGVLGET